VKQTDINFKYRGKAFGGTVAIPESLGEAVQLIGEDQCYRHFLSAYLEEQKKTLRRKRDRKRLVLALRDLSSEQLLTLRSVGLLK